MRRIGEILITIECEEEHVDYIASIIEAGADANGYVYESIPVDASTDFGLYFKLVKEE